MTRENGNGRKRFYVELIKPSHYDDDGYVIQWRRSFIPSNSLACLNALVDDSRRRNALGDDVDIVINAYDETHTVIPIDEIIARINGNPEGGIVFLVGVQTNQFPRARDLARPLRKAGVRVAVGGFHVSGCMAMLNETPPDIQAMLDMGVTIFAGEAEGRMDEFLRRARSGHLEPSYDFMDALPELEGQIRPVLPEDVTSRYMRHFTSFDAGRGCPFQCSFCTIINVQGRKSRYRSADDIEEIVRHYAGRGLKRFFISDDDFARNKNWEPIFDRLAHLREKEHLRIKFTLQVDTQCHRIPGFVEKAARAGCNRVFIGLENINPDNLKSASKHQNHITEYRELLQAFRAHKVTTYAGYILGFPADTPESIERDIKVIQRELPVDILEFFVLTPLPGSADHKRLHESGVWMDPDMNKYDLEHVTTVHDKMSREEVQDIYEKAWDIYYTPEHIETLMRRGEASGITAKRIARMVTQFYGSFRYERVHPLQSGLFRRKVRTTRRSEMKVENPLIFYPKRLWQVLGTYIPGAFFFWKLQRMRKRIEKEGLRDGGYEDHALAPTRAGAEADLEMYHLTDAAEKAVARERARRKPKPKPKDREAAA